MAGAIDNPSRRALLGAALGFPLLPLDGGGQVGVAVRPGAVSEGPHSTSAATPPLTPPHRGEGEWRRALAAWRAAEAAVRAEERATAGCTAEAEAAREEIYGGLLDGMYAALRRLMRVAAPDLAAFAVKFELAIAHEVATLNGGEACLAAMRRDVRRLAGLA